MSSIQPLVSVIIPTFNRGPFIGQAITSVLNQTYENIELFVIDDGSSDDTEAVATSFDDTRLHFVKLAKNVGRSAARNVGLTAAKGRFITFLDSDDYYLPEKVERQIDFLEKHPEFGMVYTASACFTDEASPIFQHYRAPVFGDIYSEIAFFKPLTITLPTVMLRREVLDTVGGFDERMSRFEDTDMWRRISRRFRIGAIDEVTCHIRTHEGNLASAFDPISFEVAIDFYLAKIREEDKDIDPLVFAAGARRLYLLYGSALLSMPGTEDFAAKLIDKGRHLFQPLVSIIIPVYNGGDYLRQAIDSALAQTYANFEIVVVNDGSTDGGRTERILESYGNSIRYVTQPNGGCSSALNRAVREAHGDFISWLSHDDLMAPAKIERQIECLARQTDPRSCVVYGEYSVFYGDDPVASDVPAVDIPVVRPEHFRYFLTTRNILHGCTLLIPRRSLIEHGLFEESLKTVLDFDLWFKLGKTERFVFCPGVGIHARAHPNQDSIRKRDLFMEEANAMLARFARELSAEEIRSASGASLMMGTYLIAETLQRRNFAEAAAQTLELADSRARELLANDRPDGDGREALETLLVLARQAVGQGIPSQLTNDLAYSQIKYEIVHSVPAAAQSVAAETAATLDSDGSLNDGETSSDGLTTCTAAEFLLWRSDVLMSALVASVRTPGVSPAEAEWDPTGKWAELLFDRHLIAASGLFDSSYYLNNNLDVAASEMDPLDHFLLYGSLEGRRPSAGFDTAHYLSSNPDVQAAGANPVAHFVKYGILENRAVRLDKRIVCKDIAGDRINASNCLLETIYGALERLAFDTIGRSSKG